MISFHPQKMSKIYCVYRSEKVEMIFSSDVSSKKQMNKQILIYYYETPGWVVFVCFLKEIEDTKKIFRN